jgi:hypothetical protein
MGITITELKQEDIDAMMEDLDREARIMGFPNLDAYNQWKHYASEGLQRFGGSFCEFIGRAMCHADQHNLMKLVLTFKPMLEEHAELYRKYLKDQKSA